MRRWLKKFWNKTPKPVIPIYRDACRMRLHEWRSTPQLVQDAVALLARREMVLMLDVLKNEHLSYSVMHPQATTEQRAAQQARCEGYSMCLANMEALAIGYNLPETINSTFETEET